MPGRSGRSAFSIVDLAVPSTRRNSRSRSAMRSALSSSRRESITLPAFAGAVSLVRTARWSRARGMRWRRVRSLILTLAYGGLRWGEAVALRRGRVDVLRRRLSIAEAATEVSGRLVFGEPKTHRRRYVHLPAFVAEELARHLQNRPTDPHTLVWVAPKGGPLRYNPYRSRVWDKAVTDAGLNDLTPHSLRHTCASLMRAAGADVKEIQVQLGHRSPMVTLSIYTHLFEDAFDSVMDRLDTDHRELVRPRSGPNVVELSRQGREQSSDQGV